MEQNKMELVLGSFLCNIGQVLPKQYEYGGYQFCKSYIQNKRVLEQIKYHTSSAIEQANLEDNSFAYITHIADKISLGINKITDEYHDNSLLQSVFNILNHNDEHKKYMPRTLKKEDGINMPVDREEGDKQALEQKIQLAMEELLSQYGNNLTPKYLEQCLETLEVNTCFIPSKKEQSEKMDISFYDHAKMIAAVGSCIYDYLQSKNITNYKETLNDQTDSFLSEDSFMIVSFDISGIQNFIYTISTDRALKNLRSRSFYLDFVMEHIVDEFLEQLSYTRANVLYTGGGHAYFIVANTDQNKQELENFGRKINQWFLKIFGISLYLSWGIGICSANQLQNKEKSYRDIFMNVSSSISERKLNRYTAEEICALNSNQKVDGSRECKVCKCVDHLVKVNTELEGNPVTEERCHICAGLEWIASKMTEEDRYIVTSTESGLGEGKFNPLPLPNEKYLYFAKLKEIEEWERSGKSIHHIYSKNMEKREKAVRTNLWVGNYSKKKEFDELVKDSKGVKRLAVLRADVDNLGQSFVSGFDHNKYGDQYVTLSRTGTFSRDLSLFFKYYINFILENGQYQLTDDKENLVNQTTIKRNIAIVYSGGDDVFVIGAWDDVIGFAVDLHKQFKQYTQGKLTISAGIGLFSEKHPISDMARQTGELEEAAKQMPNKNAVALFTETLTFEWEVLIEKVLGEKFTFLSEFFQNVDEKGKNFLYHLLDLIRDEKEKINLARYAYTLARLEASEGKKEEKNKFSKQMYEWYTNGEDRKQLIAAMYLYVYLTREDKQEGDNRDGI